MTQRINNAEFEQRNFNAASDPERMSAEEIAIRWATHHPDGNYNTLDDLTESIRTALASKYSRGWKEGELAERMAIRQLVMQYRNSLPDNKEEVRDCLHGILEDISVRNLKEPKGDGLASHPAGAKGKE